MKKIVFITLVGLIFLTTSCLNDEGYSLSNMWEGFGMLHEVEPGLYKIVMDDGDILIPVASNHNHPWQEDVHDDYGKPLAHGDRLLVNFTILSDETDENGNVSAHLVKLNTVKKVLLKDIIDINVNNADSIGNDPIIITNYWLTDSLINFRIKYWGDSQIHYINLVKQPGNVEDFDQPIELELRHNTNGDFEYIPYSAFVSFNLTKLQITGTDSVQFSVLSVDYNDNENVINETYKYAE